MDPNLARQFDDELNAWGNYQTVRKSTEKAATTQQGLFEPRQLIQAAREGNRRATASGDARFQRAAQEVQTTTAQAKANAQQGLEQAKARVEALRKKAAKLNPTPWETTVATAAMSAPFVPASMGASIPLGVGLGALGSTQSAQRALAGQTEPQKLLADLLRQYEGSGLQQAGQAMQFALPNAVIMNQQEGY
jgi:vacuolar-type H+-ATPase subunit H